MTPHFHLLKLNLTRATAVVATALAAACMLGASASAQTRQSGVLGTWIDHTGRGAVEFAACGSNVCGRIVWMKQPRDEQGRLLVDDLNPNQSLRRKPVCGLQVVGNAQPQSDDTFDNGWIYNPEDGGRYSVELKLISPNVLRVHGYAGIKFLGETYVWKRATGNLARCTE